MILMTRSVGIAKGKNAGAIAQAKAVAEYLKANMGLELHVGVPIGGNPMRVTWAGRYDSMAQMEEIMEKMAGDAAFQELVAKGLDNYVEGSMEDRIMKVV
jgi:hypothetical protein